MAGSFGSRVGTTGQLVKACLLLLRLHFKVRLCHEKTHLKLQEEVDAAQDQRHVGGLRPCEDLPYSGKGTDYEVERDSARMVICQVACKLDAISLLLAPVQPELNAQVVRQHVNCRPAIQQ